MISPREVIAVLAHPACRDVAKHTTVKYKTGLVQPLASIGWPTRTAHIVGFYYKDTAIWNRTGDSFCGAKPTVHAAIQAARDINAQIKVRERRVMQDILDVQALRDERPERLLFLNDMPGNVDAKSSPLHSPPCARK